MNEYIEALRETHNELKEELEAAETPEERALVRGKRLGLLTALAEYNHQQSDDEEPFMIFDEAASTAPRRSTDLPDNFGGDLIE